MTLAERDGALVQLGQVGGLGKGERIRGVRFLGEVGYVGDLPPDRTRCTRSTSRGPPIRAWPAS